MNNSRFWDGYACWIKRTLNDHCSNASQCRDYESLSCLNGQCKIFYLFFKDMISFNSLLYFIEGNCTIHEYWDSTNQKCIDKNYSYSINGCFDSTDCDSKKSLVCNLDTNCNCPIMSTQGMCDCERSLNNEYYWNGNTCVVALSPGDSCANLSTSYMCQTLTQGTICNNTSGSYKCECPSGPQWFWSNSSLVCIECPIGWIIYSGHCYYINKNGLSWDDSLTWCRNNSAEFLIVNDPDEYNLLYNFYVTYLGSGTLWVIKKLAL